MKVAVCIVGMTIPAWHHAVVTKLRAVEGVEVRLVSLSGRAWTPPRGVSARIMGSAFAPATIRAAERDLGGDEDVVVDLSGSGVTSSARHGVWSFQIGSDDGRALPFAQEIVAYEDVAEITLARHGGAGTAALRSGRFPLGGWYPVATRIALAEAARWPALLAGVLVAGGTLVGLPLAASAPAPVDRRHFYRTIVRRMASGLFGGLTHADLWNVGFAQGGPRRLLDDEPLTVRWLAKPRPKSFLADPFFVERDGIRALFAEDFDYVRQRGVIDMLELDNDNNIVRRERIIDSNTHLSYPFPLEIDGRLYIIPESCSANEVALYRCVRFPDRWERETALFPEFDGVDTTLFPHDGRWWAFCTRYSGGSSLALHALHAPHPRGPWAEHALNPIVVDIASARPAGAPFVVDGTLYRLGQDCSQTYGGAVAIARVDDLTPSTYRETLVKRIAPLAGPYSDGIHTIHFSGDTIVVDGKRTFRDLRMLPRGVRAIVARRMSRLLGRSA